MLAANRTRDFCLSLPPPTNPPRSFVRSFHQCYFPSAFSPLSVSGGLLKRYKIISVACLVALHVGT